MKWPAKVFLALAVLVGIYYGADARDRDRWMAALGLSASSAGKLREQIEREKDLARQAAEEARWRAAGQMAGDTDAVPDATFNRDVICEGIEHREALVKGDERETDRSVERMKRICSNM
jgi:hypothetical protein